MRIIKVLLFFLLILSCAVAAAVCNDTIPKTAPDSAFSVDNGLVTDNRTGLMWRQCSEGQSGVDCSEGDRDSSFFTWQEALEHVKSVNSNSGDGYSDWRLPNKKELETIIENSCVAPSINENFFYMFPSRSFYADARYWTSTTLADDPQSAWVALFQYGAILPAKKSGKFFIRLVRGGQSLIVNKP